jgi:hypothetical protein
VIILKKELKKFLDKEDTRLLYDFRWAPNSGNEFLEFMKLVREELNYTPEYDFIRMINHKTGEVKQCDATEEGYNALCTILTFDEPYLESVKFEGNKNYVERLNKLKQNFQEI